MKNYGSTPMLRIASGLGGSDTSASDIAIFMERVMKRRHPVRTDGVSIHYYVYLRNHAQHSATQFGEREWYEVLKLADDIDDVITRNAAVLDRYDPDKRIWLTVDEWGTWYPPAPGTNPEYLYQQNTVRDALVAAQTLHIFQKHSDRVQMANIAQTVNVLQSLFLTQGEKLVLTPTYHVFDLLQGHQDADKLAYDLTAATFEVDGKALNEVSVGVSRSAGGEVLLTLANLRATERVQLDITLDGRDVTGISGRELAADHITALNTFETPDRVQTRPFSGAAQVAANHLQVELSPASVTALTLR
jgi:alpha-N-arabinofuranosidase